MNRANDYKAIRIFRRNEVRMKPSQEDINRRKDVWQMILWRMGVHRFTPKKLASQTPYSQSLIEKGISGEPIPLTLPFLRACVKAFGSAMGRIDCCGRIVDDGKTVDDMPYDECVDILKPPPEMPPRQGNFWEYEDE
jgi:hypothetical protein